MVIVPQHDESKMPITLGSPLRVPKCAWKSWGISWSGEVELRELIKASEDAYRAEWDIGAGRHDVVAQASVNAGFGNNNQYLREAAAQYINWNITRYNDNVNILDVGAGAGDSALVTFDGFDPNDKDRASFTLLDPSGENLEKAGERMRERGARYQLVHATDLEIPRYLGDGSQHIVMGVASIHHHAGIPWHIYRDVLVKGGLFVSADWHNGVWMHPAKVYKMLQELDCSQDGLGNFAQTYPSATQEIELTQADLDIIAFWKGYKDLLEERGELGQNAIWPLEGHRPAERYVRDMKYCGLIVPERYPHRVTQRDSDLLMLTPAYKKEVA